MNFGLTCYEPPEGPQFATRPRFSVQIFRGDTPVGPAEDRPTSLVFDIPDGCHAVVSRITYTLEEERLK